MSKLFNKIKKASYLEKFAVENSRFLQVGKLYDTGYPILNLAFSGSFSGGLPKGATMLAAPSKHFKSNYMVMAMAAFQNNSSENSVIVYYDSEGGTKVSTLKGFGVDVTESRFMHTPVKNLEDFKFDIVKVLDSLDPEDEVMIAVDSLGNLPSKKEIDDALTGSSAADMTRAKVMKGISRMICPQLNDLEIPFFGLNHAYQTQDRYPKTVMSGGTGMYYIADSVLIPGRVQEKSGKELEGFDFKLKVDKSRFLKEGKVLPFPVTFNGGPDKWGPILQLAIDYTDIVDQHGAWYMYPGSDNKVRKTDILKDVDFMESLLTNDDFVLPVEEEFKLPSPEDIQARLERDLEKEIPVDVDEDDSALYDNTELIDILGD